MKLSVSTSSVFGALGIDEGFKTLKEAGFDAVDLGLDNSYKWEDLCNGKKNDFYDDENIYPYIEKIKAASEKYGVEIGQTHAPFPIYFSRSQQSTINCQADARKTVELTGLLGCHCIVIHPIYADSARFPALTKKQEYDLNIEFYTSLIPLLKKYNITCCLEDLGAGDWKTGKTYAGVCADIHETIKYIDDLNAIAGEKLFGFCLDIGHLLILGQDPCYWMEELGDRLETLHVHDNSGNDDGHTLPYMGCCNWDRVVLGLRRNGYKNNFSFETGSFNNAFPKELCVAATNMLGAVGKYFVGRITAEEDKK